jgi:transcriptional regulator with XRE-family HTH domain
MSTHHLQFQQLRRAKGLTLQAIAVAAGISLTDVYLFEIHCLTDAAIRRTIVQAFSRLTGESYQISDFEPGSSAEEQPTLVMNTLRQSQRFTGGNHDLCQ